MLTIKNNLSFFWLALSVIRTPHKHRLIQNNFDKNDKTFPIKLTRVIWFMLLE